VGGRIRQATDDVIDEANRPVAVHYEVTGDATDATIHYTTFGEGMTSNTETVATCDDFAG